MGGASSAANILCHSRPNELQTGHVVQGTPVTMKPSISLALFTALLLPRTEPEPPPRRQRAATYQQAPETQYPAQQPFDQGARRRRRTSPRPRPSRRKPPPRPRRSSLPRATSPTAFRCQTSPALSKAPTRQTRAWSTFAVSRPAPRCAIPTRKNLPRPLTSRRSRIGPSRNRRRVVRAPPRWTFPRNLGFFSTFAG